MMRGVVLAERNQINRSHKPSGSGGLRRLQVISSILIIASYIIAFTSVLLITLTITLSIYAAAIISLLRGLDPFPLLLLLLFDADCPPSSLLFFLRTRLASWMSMWRFS
jgi:uncharacterized membrane protein